MLDIRVTITCVDYRFYFKSIYLSCFIIPEEGSCIVVDVKDSPSLVKVLTGPSVDPITTIVFDSHRNVYTSCRDGCVRLYRRVI